MNIVILDGRALNPGDLSWDSFKQFGNVIYYPQTDTEDQTIVRLQNTQIALLNKVPITEKVLAACPELKLICVLATGYNVVDIQAAARRGIPVCNVPGYGTAAVAQFTFALLLELCHRVGHHDHVVHGGKWSRSPDFCFWDTPQMELAGKTMGIIGYGSIGQAVGNIARAFGMELIAHSRTHHPGVDCYVELDELLSRADVISLHCPLFPETAGMINDETIAKMKDGVILLNTARGALVDEKALTAGLCSGKIRGAAVDVVSGEPIAEDNPLLTAPNCIITPHMAWAPLESRQRILDTTAKSIRTFLSGENVPCVNL